MPLVFAIIRKKEAKFVTSNYPDIKDFGRKMAYPDLSDKYVIFGESEETAEHVLIGPVSVFFKKCELLNSILTEIIL